MADDIELSSLSSSLSKRHSRGSTSLQPELDGSMSVSTSASRTPSFEEQGTDISTPQWALQSRKERIKHFFKAAWEGPAVIADNPPSPIRSLEFIEDLPQKFRLKTSYWTRVILLAIYLILWASTWSRLLLPYLSEIPLVGDDKKEVISLTCGQADDFWKGKNAACGLDAQNCPSVDTNSDVVFRCPALCDRGSWLYSLRAVGDQIVKYRGYFIGGGERRDGEDALSFPYRADSFPCGAAVHSGVVSPFFGGCARISYSSGSQSSFLDTRGHYGVSDSVGFDSFFPYLYYFKALAAHATLCYDPRLLVLFLNVLLGLPVVFLGSGAAFFWIMSVVGFWTISLATDPPVLVEPQDPESFYELISLSLERFLPTCFVLFFLWKVSIKRTFGGLSSYSRVSNFIADDTNSITGEEGTSEYPHAKYSSLSRLFLWYPFFWLGVLNNISFDRLPVDRLTWHDLQVQPGALITVVIVGSILVCCIVAQAYYVWLLGRFWKLLLVYGLMFASLFVFANIPGLSLRVHHYIFALMFIPGCSTKGKTAYVFQGILLGLFLSGVARWGFASIAETNLSLLRGEPLGKINPPTLYSLSDGILYWKEEEVESGNTAALKELEKYSGVSLLINDVERYRGPNEGNFNITKLFEEDLELKSLVEKSLQEDDAKDANNDISIYLRIAKFDPERTKYGDYNKASLVKYPSFGFSPAPPGIT